MCAPRPDLAHMTPRWKNTFRPLFGATMMPVRGQPTGDEGPPFCRYVLRKPPCSSRAPVAEFQKMRPRSNRCADPVVTANSPVTGRPTVEASPPIRVHLAMMGVGAMENHVDRRPCSHLKSSPVM